MKHQKFLDWLRVWMLLAICTSVLVLLPWSGSAAPTPQAAGADQSAAKPKLAGTWKLNKDQSDDQLVVVTRGMHKGKMTRTYALSPDVSQLYVTIQMESKRFSQPVAFRLVYDPVKASGGGTQ